MKQALPLIIRRMNQIIILALYIKDQQKSRVRSALKTPSSSLKVTEGWPSASLCIDELAEFTHKLDFPESHHKLIWCQLSVSPWCGGSLSKTEEELFLVFDALLFDFFFWRSRRASKAPLQLHVENLCVTALRLAIHRWDFPKFYSLVIKLTISKRLFLAQFTRLLKFLLLNWVYIPPLDWQFDDKFGKTLG